MRVLVLVLFLLAVFGASPPLARSQEAALSPLGTVAPPADSDLSKNYLPPIPASGLLAAADRTPTAGVESRKKRGLRYYLSPVPKNWEEAALYGGLAFDMASTIAFMRHPRYVSANDGSFANYSHAGFFTEGGWAKFAGNRNTAGVVALNIGLDAGIVALNRFVLAKTEGRGGGWRVLRFVSAGFVVAKGAEHVYLGAHNYLYIARWERYLTRGLQEGSYFWHDEPIE